MHENDTSNKEWRDTVQLTLPILISIKIKIFFYKKKIKIWTLISGSS